MEETAGALMIGYSASTTQLTRACHGQLWMVRYMLPPSLHPERDQALTVAYTLTWTIWRTFPSTQPWPARSLHYSKPTPALPSYTEPVPLIPFSSSSNLQLVDIGASVFTHTFVPPARRDHIRRRIACRPQQTVFFTVLHCLISTLRRADHNRLWLQAISHLCCHCVGVSPLLPDCMVY